MMAINTVTVSMLLVKKVHISMSGPKNLKIVVTSLHMDLDGRVSDSEMEINCLCAAIELLGINEIELIIDPPLLTEYLDKQ